MNKLYQNQNSGDNSTNVQAQCVYIGGVSYADVKEIASDTFNDNFIKLKREVAIIAQERAQEINDKFIDELMSRHPESLNQFANPALLDALFTVQKQYAISGDKDLGDLLVDILVDRVAAPKRNMLQIILDESLLIAPKLTLEQLDSLTLIFVLTKSSFSNIKNYQELLSQFRRKIVPFVKCLSDKKSDYDHAEYLRCGFLRAGDCGQLEEIFRRVYRVYFSNGFSEEELKEKIGEGKKLDGLLIRCFHDKTKLQISALNEKILTEVAEKNGLDIEIQKKLKLLFESSTKPAHEVKQMLINEIPEMKKIFETWTRAPLNRFELNGVGISIAQANYRRRIGEALDLPLWIN
jgi:hypothetical protein